MKLTRYSLTTPRPEISFRAAVVADLHDRSYDRLLPLLKKQQPDLILIPGDLCERLSPVAITDPTAPPPRPGLDFLRLAASIAPTFYALGNHEVGGTHSAVHRARRTGIPIPPFTFAECRLDAIRQSGAILLDNDCVTLREGKLAGLTIGGLGTGLLYADTRPRLDMLNAFTAADGYKLLLCHHPEYYNAYLRPYDIDLVVSGHAHGGQWRLFGRGVYAPDQGLFPRYTSGVHEGRLVISRGVTNSVPGIPRFFNRCELVMIEVTSGMTN